MKVPRITDPNSLVLIFCGLMTSLRVLDEHLAEGEKQRPDYRAMNIGIIPVMSITASLGAELMLKYAYECDHGEAYPLGKGKQGHDLKQLYDGQQESRRDAINRQYRIRYKEMKAQDMRLIVGFTPPERANLKEYESAQDVVDNEANIFVRARYLAEVFEVTSDVVAKFKIDTRPYHIWALAKGIFDTIDWKNRLRPDNIVVSTNL